MYFCQTNFCEGVLFTRILQEMLHSERDEIRIYQYIRELIKSMSLLQGSTKGMDLLLPLCFSCVSVKNLSHKRRFFIRSILRRIPKILNDTMFIISDLHIISNI
jgi:hypothetical protein